ncbi:FAD-binding protein [Leucobacter luti]|uniref:FAD-binding protein n=1 Tax=Leucobacter luti TaxID=340320 RepID=UPI00215DBE12|nr:FAD-binding protein [Leucobacter luti]
MPAHVDGLMLGIAERAGARLINGDRMWHYTEGIANHSPVWPAHGIRILPGPSSLWLDASGHRLPAPHYPGFDTLDTLTRLRATGHDHSWFVTTERIAGTEFALSGSEQNPDLTGKSLRLLRDRLGSGAPAPVQAFLDRGADFVVADSLDQLIDGMQMKSPVPLDRSAIHAAVNERDRGFRGSGPLPHARAGATGIVSDAQLDRVRVARNYLGDKLVRVAAPHALTDSQAGPLVAVKLHLLTRKSLGGLHTDLSGRVLGPHGTAVPGLFAAGEAAGFGVAGCTGTGRSRAHSSGAACLPGAPQAELWRQRSSRATVRGAHSRRVSDLTPRLWISPRAAAGRVISFPGCLCAA